MRKLSASTLLLLVLAIAACGSSAPPPPNNSKVNAPAVNTPAGTKGPAYTNEYRAAADKALGAYRAYLGNKTPDSFALAGAAFYDALRYRAMHVKNGHTSEGLHKYTELNRDYQDWKKTIGPKGWEDNATYKSAKAEYDKVQSAN
ncbi:MAG: hypothetical protein KF754_07115 [Planctomycetes bacterium]|nr:hypothetical protein [Planctomycetota bacterium]